MGGEAFGHEGVLHSSVGQGGKREVGVWVGEHPHRVRGMGGWYRGFLRGRPGKEKTFEL